MLLSIILKMLKFRCMLTILLYHYVIFNTEDDRIKFQNDLLSWTDEWQLKNNYQICNIIHFYYHNLSSNYFLTIVLPKLVNVKTIKCVFLLVVYHSKKKIMTV